MCEGKEGGGWRLLFMPAKKEIPKWLGLLGLFDVQALRESQT